MHSPYPETGRKRQAASSLEPRYSGGRSPVNSRLESRIALWPTLPSSISQHHLLRTGCAGACLSPDHPLQDETMNTPLPASLPVPAQYQVTDDHGRILRSEALPPGADLHDRLRLAHRNYQLQGWTVDPLLPGRGSFFAEKAGRRLSVGIRPSHPATTPINEGPNDQRNQHGHNGPGTGQPG